MNIKDIFVHMAYGQAPEDREVAELWYGGRHNTLLHYINGEWREPASGDFFESSNPACNEVLARVADGNAEDTDRAVAAAAAVRGRVPARVWPSRSTGSRGRLGSGLVGRVGLSPRLLPARSLPRELR